MKKRPCFDWAQQKKKTEETGESGGGGGKVGEVGGWDGGVLMQVLNMQCVSDLTGYGKRRRHVRFISRLHPLLPRLTKTQGII